MKIGFDNDKYLTMQSEHIRDRISKFDNKLYLDPLVAEARHLPPGNGLDAGDLAEDRQIRHDAEIALRARKCDAIRSFRI